MLASILHILLAAKAPQIAVLPITAHGIDSSEAAVLTDALSDALLRTGGFRVMERERMGSILEEQGFQRSGACDGLQCAVQLGRILGTDQIVVGSIGRLGTSWVLSLRRVDVGTGEIVASSSRDQRGAIDELLRGAIPGAASDLSGAGRSSAAPFSERRGAELPSNRALRARSGRILSTGSRSLEAALDGSARPGDLFRFGDSGQGRKGWIRITSPSRPRDSIESSRAFIVSGDPEAGQRIEFVGSASWSFQASVGMSYFGAPSRVDPPNPEDPHVSRVRNVEHSQDLSTMAWWHWRSPDLWLGSGLGLTFQSIDEKRYNTQLGQQIAQSTQSRVASSLHLSTRKDAPIFRGIGAFLQLGGYLPMQEAIPDCQWMSFHFAPRFGGYYELSPHLGLEVAASEDCWDFGPHCFHDFQSERIRVAYGFAIGWTP